MNAQQRRPSPASPRLAAHLHPRHQHGRAYLRHGLEGLHARHPRPDRAEIRDNEKSESPWHVAKLLSAVCPTQRERPCRAEERRIDPSRSRRCLGKALKTGSDPRRGICGRACRCNEEQMVQFGDDEGGKIQRALRRHPHALGTRSIVLVGLMGCGKSAIGRRLAATPRPAVRRRRRGDREGGRQEHRGHLRRARRGVLPRRRAQGDRAPAGVGPAGAGHRRRRLHERGDARQHPPITGSRSGSRPSCRVLVRRVLKRDNRPLLERRIPRPSCGS